MNNLPVRWHPGGWSESESDWSVGGHYSSNLITRRRTAFLRAAEIWALPLAGLLLLGPAARGGMAGGRAEVGWRFSGVFRFGARRFPTCFGALPMPSTAAATAPA